MDGGYSHHKNVQYMMAVNEMNFIRRDLARQSIVKASYKTQKSPCCTYDLRKNNYPTSPPAGSGIRLQSIMNGPGCAA